MVFMRKIIPENVIKSLYWFFKRTENIEIIGLVVLSTQLHEEMLWRFPFAYTRDYSVLFVAIRSEIKSIEWNCRFYFWSDCNEISSAFES